MNPSISRIEEDDREIIDMLQKCAKCEACGPAQQFVAGMAKRMKTASYSLNVLSELLCEGANWDDVLVGMAHEATRKAIEIMWQVCASLNGGDTGISREAIENRYGKEIAKDLRHMAADAPPLNE